MNNLFSAAALALLLVTSSTVFAANPQVKMETSKGTVLIELYPDKAPVTVENFLRYAREGKYDGTIFHRVIKRFMNQGGGYRPDFTKVETYPPIKNEADNGLKNTVGTIAMARTNDAHSATNQFFINTVDNSSLDHISKTTSRNWGYCVFGKVIEGMEVMDRISRVATGSGDVPQTEILIKKVTVINDSAKQEKPAQPAKKQNKP